MKKYFDVYIRQAGTPFALADLDTTHVMDDFDRLELLNPGAKFTIEPVKTPLGDGCELTEAEKVSVEAGTLRTDIVEYEHLRDEFHNQYVDVLFLDPNDHSIACVAFNVRASVEKLVESGQTIICMVKGAKEFSIEATARFDIARIYPSAVISGYVYDLDGDPVSGATVNIEVTSPAQTKGDLTDKDGHFLALIKTLEGKTEFTSKAEKSGMSFPVAKTGEVYPNTEVTVVIQEEEA